MPRLIFIAGGYIAMCGGAGLTLAHDPALGFFELGLATLVWGHVWPFSDGQ